ncbi:MAG: NAD(P)H-binding protein [Gemmatimonadales bacterium]|nr:NAD(P)H-binding protein [Gemmatimonadales bacterium]
MSIEVVAGDVGDPASLGRAFEDCRGVHISIAGSLEPASAEAAVGLAREHGLSRVGYVSGSTVDERNRWFPMVEQRLLAEQAVQASGVA